MLVLSPLDCSKIRDMLNDSRDIECYLITKRLYKYLHDFFLNILFNLFSLKKSSFVTCYIFICLK